MVRGRGYSVAVRRRHHLQKSQYHDAERERDGPFARVRHNKSQRIITVWHRMMPLIGHCSSASSSASTLMQFLDRLGFQSLSRPCRAASARTVITGRFDRDNIARFTHRLNASDIELWQPLVMMMSSAVPPSRCRASGGQSALAIPADR